jgi:membrane-bound lytic murein transglycosylase D
LLETKLKTLTAEFGVSANNIPAEFVEKVRRWVWLYQTRDEDEIERVLETRRQEFIAIQRQVRGANLPSDLAYVTLVESHFQPQAKNKADNAGLWQFTRGTARHIGLRVNAEVDERLDPHKSTAAACRYISQLQRHLGTGGSLMLALAAYNMGPGRLEQRMNQVEDPARRFDFWHLYRTRVFPALTRTHLARLMAAILIGRHPQHFGFPYQPTTSSKTVSSPTAPAATGSR